MRGRRFIGVFIRAGLLFGLLFGLFGGGLTASLLGLVLPRFGIHLWPMWQLIPAMVLGIGIPMGLLIALADYNLTRTTPPERLDPTGAVRQQVTLEIPLPPDRALEAISRLVFEDLGWGIESRAEGHLTLRTPPRFRSLGEQVTVDLHPMPGGSAVLISSRPLSFVIVVDYNKNRENVLLLREKILNVKF